jgi:hypothetical protein
VTRERGLARERFSGRQDRGLSERLLAKGTREGQGDVRLLAPLGSRLPFSPLGAARGQSGSEPGLLSEDVGSDGGGGLRPLSLTPHGGLARGERPEQQGDREDDHQGDDELGRNAVDSNVHAALPACRSES